MFCHLYIILVYFQPSKYQLVQIQLILNRKYIVNIFQTTKGILSLYYRLCLIFSFVNVVEKLFEIRKIQMVHSEKVNQFSTLKSFRAKDLYVSTAYNFLPQETRVVC